MKNVLFTLFCLFAFARSYAQDASNVVKVGYGGVAFEHALTDHFSFLVSVPFSFELAAGGGETGTAFGSGIEGDLRLYPLNARPAPAGLYVSPGVGYLFGSASVSDGIETDRSSYSGYFGKGVLGYQWIWDRGFAMDLNAGIGYFNLKYNEQTGPFAGIKATAITPVFGFSVGYAF